MAKQPDTTREKPQWRSSDDIFREELEILEEGFRHVAETEESARAFLIRAGILDEDGELAEPYR